MKSIMTGTAGLIGLIISIMIVAGMGCSSGSKGGGTSRPAAPTSLTATPGDAQVTLQWTAPPGTVTGYNIYVSQSSSGGYSKAGPSQTTSYIDASLTNGTTYYFTVTALNVAGEGTPAGPVHATPSAQSGPPAAPTNLAATPGDAQVALQWTAPPGTVTGYNVYASQSSSGGYSKAGSSQTTSYTDAGLTNGTAYYFTVTAVNGAGEGAPAGPVSATPQAPPLKVVGAQGIASTIYTAYNAGTYPTDITPGYQPIIYFSNTTQNQLTVNAIDESGSTSGLIPPTGTTYYWSNLLDPTYPMTACTIGTDCQVPVGGYFAIKLPVLSAETQSSGGDLTGTVDLVLQDQSGKSLGVYVKQLRYVDVNPHYLPVYLVNTTAPQQPLYFAATGKDVTTGNGPYVITFTTVNGRDIGTLSSDSVIDFTRQGNYAEITGNGTVLYLPYAKSGKIWITDHSGGFDNTSGQPSEETTDIPFIVYEFTYQPESGGNCPSDTEPAYCDQAVFDQSYVNSFYMAGDMDALGQSGGSASSNFQQQSFALDNDFGLTAKGRNTSFTDIVSTVRNAFQAYSDWNSPNFERVGGIIAPISLATYNSDGSQTPNNPFPLTYYQGYVNVLWTYLASHPIQIYLNPATYGSNCVVQGAIVGSQLVFTQATGTYNGNPISCVSSAASIDPAYPGYADNLTPGDPAQVKFDAFNACDFFQGGGSSLCHSGSSSSSTNVGLWGPNGTFRAWIGEALASYQAIGLLPYCDNPAAVMSQSLSSQVLAGGKGFTNPSCLSGLTGPTYNLYVKSLFPYVDVYTYSYGDYLGLDGTVTYDRENFPPAGGLQEPKNDYNNQIAFPQPVTITIH